MQSLPRPPEDELMASCFRFCARTSNTRICVLLGSVLFQMQTHSLIQRSTAPIINDNLMNTPWRSLRINEQSQTRARCAAPRCDAPCVYLCHQLSKRISNFALKVVTTGMRSLLGRCGWRLACRIESIITHTAPCLS